MVDKPVTIYYNYVQDFLRGVIGMTQTVNFRRCAIAMPFFAP